MRRLTAEWLILRGTGAQAAGDLSAATRSFRLAARLAPSWEAPHFHLGLIARQAGDWEVSLQSNQKAVALSGWPSDEALWNLGIAATAVHNWAEARRAWRGYGFDIPEGQGELTMEMAPVCLRLNPHGNAVLVWGQRIDPARSIITSVPLPGSNHRYHDIILHDGENSGVLEAEDGRTTPIFNALKLWKRSEYLTFRSTVHIAHEDARRSLGQLCLRHGICIEEWAETGDDDFGFAACNGDLLVEVLAFWKTLFPECAFAHPEKVKWGELDSSPHLQTPDC